MDINGVFNSKIIELNGEFELLKTVIILLLIKWDQTCPWLKFKGWWSDGHPPWNCWLLALGARLIWPPSQCLWSDLRRGGCWLLFVLPTFRTFWKGTPHIETLEKHPILNKLNPLQSIHVDPVSPRYYHNQTIYCNMNKFLNWLVMGQADVVQHGSVLASSSLPERSA